MALLYRNIFQEEICFTKNLFNRLLILRFRCKIRHQGRRDWMGTEPALYQLMRIRMNSVMNDITNSDGEYQAIIRKSDEYSGRLDGLELPREVRLLIDGYVSEQNAHLTSYACEIDPGMGCLPTC